MVYGRRYVVAVVGLLTASGVFAGQGLYLAVNSPIPGVKLIKTDDNCVDHTGNFKDGLNNGEFYLEADNDWSCLFEDSTVDFKLEDANGNTIAKYELTISANGSEIENTKIAPGFNQSNILYPHSGLFGDQDHVSVSVYEPYTDWMSTLNGGLRLNDLFWPGSHDSGTYDFRSPYTLTPDNDSSVIKDAVDTGLGKVVAGWADAQRWRNNNDEDDVKQTVTTQLNSGIRYLDLRICQLPDEPLSLDNIYICHSIAAVKFSDVIDEVKAFVREHKKEIVILDINHVYADDSKDDQKLLGIALGYISQQLGDQLAEKYNDQNALALTPSSTLNDFWQQQKSVVVAIPQDMQTASTQWAWNSVNSSNFNDCDSLTDVCSIWNNENDKGDLLDDIKQNFATLPTDHRYLFVSQNQMTPTSSDITDAIADSNFSHGLLSMTGSYKDDITNALYDIQKGHRGIVNIEDYSNQGCLIKI
ncbi:MAG: phosphatidylinositol-specific phospholipase C domain-containing protein [Francisellaceae bacterium]